VGVTAVDWAYAVLPFSFPFSPTAALDLVAAASRHHLSLQSHSPSSPPISPRLGPFPSCSGVLAGAGREMGPFSPGFDVVSIGAISAPLAGPFFAVVVVVSLLAVDGDPAKVCINKVSSFSPPSPPDLDPPSLASPHQPHSRDPVSLASLTTPFHPTPPPSLGCCAANLDPFYARVDSPVVGCSALFLSVEMCLKVLNAGTSPLPCFCLHLWLASDGCSAYFWLSNALRYLDASGSVLCLSDYWLFQYSLCCRTSIGFELPRLCHSFCFIGDCSILSVFLWDLEIFKL
jgi:hypothetical protein